MHSKSRDIAYAVIPAKHQAFAAQRQLKLLVFILLLCFPSAWAQVKSGTVIIILFSKEKVVLAGDSRVLYVREGAEIKHRDDECKIFALNNNVIYAASGIIGHGFLPGETGTAWDAHREAAQIASHATDIEMMANTWAARMKERIDADLINYPRLFDEKLRSSNLLLSAVFAGFDANGKLAVSIAALTCECSLPLPRYAVTYVRRQKPVDDGLPSGIIGKNQANAIFDELIAGKTARATMERHHWEAFHGRNRDANITVRTTEFIIKNSNTNEVGGDVDAVEINAKGRIRWIHRKKNCPER